ncbi:MAG: hypothetical protein RL385_5990 [Pseudomonadota bacterium]|jgi:hypothetical protein
MTGKSVPTQVQREGEVTGFSVLLAAFLERHRALHAVCLVDEQGECVDEASRIPSDESAIIGATWTVLRPLLEEHAALLGGDVYLWSVDTTECAYAMRRVAPTLSAFVAGGVGSIDRRVIDDLHRLCEGLRAEAGYHAEPGDAWGTTVEAEVRASKRWGYAPLRYCAFGGVWSAPLEVLGRYTEVWAGLVRVCFLVRDADVERTLCHDVERNRWFLR